ncbi:MAG: MBL fold metallo-hydrolase [Eubacteriales bacterium]|nr:MBL fold metallo-hydrolase [Eubacteriales bacterium]
MKIRFCGAARCVTGSCHLITFADKSILVDCGMRQGADTKTGLPEGEFPFDPASLDAVLITHAHIDHTGLLPLLVKRGFKGSIYTTSATAELCSIMLPDSGHIQEQEAEYQSRKNERAGKPPVEPLYTAQDAVACMKYFKGVSYNETVTVTDGASVRFTDVGHLLGSAAIELWVEENGKKASVLFSGDVGRDDRPIIKDPESVDGADYLLLEATYGDRNHDASTDDEKKAQFANALKLAIARGGNIVIPSFAIGRTQEILFYIKRMLIENTVPGLERVPVYIDSPLGIAATDIYQKCEKEFYDQETRDMAKDGDTFAFPTLRVAQTADESKAINDQKGCNIIISSSGMCEAGRIRHHLKHNLYRADSTVIFAGYQAVGTLGRMLVDGAEKIKIFGEEIRVNATIDVLEGFSGHAGKDELIEWVQEMKVKPSCIYLVHGEESALSTLAAALESLQYTVEIPELYDEIDLASGRRKKAEVVPFKPAAQPQKDKKGRPAPIAADANDYAKRIRKQAQRITALLEQVEGSPENATLLRMMEKDLRLFTEKWEDFFLES